jgi:predicted secreted hydrolase
VLVGLLVLGSACARPLTPLPPAPVAVPTPLPAVQFPRDALPHDVLTEWWYVTGHLTDGQAEYGFEFTVFQARRYNAPTGYLAHFAITDVAGQRFSHQARVSQGEPSGGFPIDVDGWRLSSDGGTDRIDARMLSGPGVEIPFALRLEAVDQKPPALHHGGLIDYGSAGVSYYYSRTLLRVQGELQTGDAAARPVTGEAWMDHQWGDFVVAGGGWDWYSLQLDDQTELMLYVLRDAAGRTTSVYGTQVLPDGSTRELEGVAPSALGQWTSPHTGATYPSGWRLTLSDARELEIEPVLQDQELYFPDFAFGGMVYWEGAVRVSGDATGRGYVELTGY